ncbi:unnamed protein product [marine sediment metagenome]|uniref:Uncharacterized protein n=1 Tax=marine sediment metagenome TaxID=412755 RepID=X1C5R3_9ZZZZ
MKPVSLPLPGWRRGLGALQILVLSVVMIVMAYPNHGFAQSGDGQISAQALPDLAAREIKKSRDPVTGGTMVVCTATMVGSARITTPFKVALFIDGAKKGERTLTPPLCYQILSLILTDSTITVL